MSSLAVFVDLDGTLVHLDRPYADITAATLTTHLGASSPALVETYREAFFAAFEALAPHPFRTGMEAVLNAAGPDVEATPEVMMATQHTEECAALTVDEAVPEALSALGTAGPLGVLTNGVPDWQRGKLDHVGLTPYVDAVVTSYEAGAHKPAPAPFQWAERSLRADEYLLIGDSDTDVEGAREAGWRWIRHEEPPAGTPFWNQIAPLT